MAHITATYVQEYFNDQSMIQSSSLSVLLTSLMDTAQDEVRQVLAEVAKVNSTLKVRCSEVRQIWGALHYARMPMDATIGYNKASSLARGLLKTAGIRWNGEPVKTKAQRAEQAAREAATELASEALQAVSYDVSKIAEGMVKIKEDRFTAGLQKYLQSAIDSGIADNTIVESLQSAIESLIGIEGGVTEDRQLRAAA